MILFLVFDLIVINELMLTVLFISLCSVKVSAIYQHLISGKLCNTLSYAWWEKVEVFVFFFQNQDDRQVISVYPRFGFCFPDYENNKIQPNLCFPVCFVSVSTVFGGISTASWCMLGLFILLKFNLSSIGIKRYLRVSAFLCLLYLWVSFVFS